MSLISPLHFCSGAVQHDASRSSSNPAEAQAVGRLLSQLAAAGVPPHCVGVICFYKAQVSAVLGVVARFAAGAAATAAAVGAIAGIPDVEAGTEEAAQSAVQIATVDSFQVGFIEAAFLSNRDSLLRAFSLWVVMILQYKYLGGCCKVKFVARRWLVLDSN